MSPDRRTFLKSAAVALGTVGAMPLIGTPRAAASTATDLGPNVLVFDPSMPATQVQASVDAVFARQQANQFGTERFALLFLPGTYDVDVNVGFYTHVAGLGMSPDDVVINGHVTVDAQWFNGNATQNFWRCAENLSVTPPDGLNRWAVAQAGPMRRTHIRGTMDLAPTGEGFSSGGFLADAMVDGEVTSGSQQQWLTRNAELGLWSGSVWNMVFVGVVNAPDQHFPSPSYTVVARTPVVREKPFLHVDGSGAYHVFVPALRTDSQGTTWSGGQAAGTSIPLEKFFVADPSHSASDINAALGRGGHLLLTPGVYRLDHAIEVGRPGTVVLGLGVATLLPTKGNSALRVADVPGVTVAGVLFDAGEVNSEELVTIGEPGSRGDHSANPTVLHDVYARIGGAAVGRATRSLVINSNNVVCDNLWLWRADHSDGVGWTVNTAANGLVVEGDDVTIYGLAVEHYQQYEVLWRGDGGRTYFFQNEFPYDVPDQASWMHGTTRGFAAYKVDDRVATHAAWGVGSYSFFNVGPAIFADRSFEVPDRLGIVFLGLVSVFLTGNGGIQHVVDDLAGPAVNGSNVVYLPRFLGGTGQVDPPAPLARTGWTATASASSATDVPANMLDGNTNTRWSSGTPMVPGMFVVIDMGAVRTINEIVMDSGPSAGDYARGYQVFLSADGTTWGNAVASGTPGASPVSARFVSSAARFVKVVQTSTAASWWSIAEFTAFG